MSKEQDAYTRSITILNSIARDRDHDEPDRRLAGQIADAALRPDMSKGQQHQFLEHMRAATDELIAREPGRRRDLEGLLDQVEFQSNTSPRVGHWLVPGQVPEGGIDVLDEALYRARRLVATETTDHDIDEEAAA